MKGTVDKLQVIRSGNTIRGPEVWEDYNPPKIRDLEREIGVLNLATVTLVETDGKKILIDVSWEGQKEFKPHSDERNRLVTELKYFGVRPAEIDEIFITHWHGDHWENIFLFPQAQVFYSGCTQSFVKERLKAISADNEIMKLNDGDEWHSGLEIMDTHGHSDHDHSVVIRYKRKDFIAVGDSIVSKMYYHTETFFPNARVEKYHDEHVASFKKIIGRADYIIPGHDGPFVNYKKDG
jgi:glyoxylase-like metal-dependent hydrolase (beta-lactamase superfamily II)